MKEKAEVNCQVVCGDYLKGDISLYPNTTYLLTINYPLKNPAVIKIKADNEGMGTNTLIRRICKEYQKIYDKEDKFIRENKVKVPKNKILDNRLAPEEETPYGIWGHDIEDLVIEGIMVDHDKKTIKIDVGS